MVFSSIPAYLDPSNWQQHPTPPPPPVPSSAQPQHVGPVGAGSIRPGSMTERARLANIPMPEGPQKCPRCESTNTKFCYFNNYSLSQPRHFCKTCRRYWTRGGALRSVPVGGGCRRNKRSKPTNSNNKSPGSGDRQNTSSQSTTVSGQTNILGLSPQLPPLRFMSPLGQLSEHFSSCDIGLNFNGISAPLVGTSEMNFPIGTNLLGSGAGGGGGTGGELASLLSNGGGIEQLRMQQAQQFPFLSGLENSSAAGLYQFQGGVQQSGFGGESSQVRAKLSASMLTQLASVKMEGNPELNLSRQFLGINSGNDQWNNNSTWTDLSSFSSSSTSNL